MRIQKSEILISVALLALMMISFVVYKPALGGPFLMDDFDNLAPLAVEVKDFSSLRDYLVHGNAGPLGRPISKLSFLIDDNAWPSSPDNFKRTNLYIHLLIGVLVFVAFRLLLRTLVAADRAQWYALTVAAIFLVHPLQVSTVAYVVQRMTQLSALFVLCGVICHVYLRHKYPSPSMWVLVKMTVSLGFWGGLAIFSKESGILLPVFIGVVELTILASLGGGNRWLSWWRRLCLGGSTAFIFAYLLYLPRWLPSYASRDFSFVERIITEPVILVDYLRVIVTGSVVGLGLFHDDFPVYSDVLLLRPFLSIVFLLACLLGALSLRKRYPVVSFGVLWFFAGHMLESTTVSLELYFEHRNYLPMLGPVVVVIFGWGRLVERFGPKLIRFLPFFALLYIAILGSSTAAYAKDWSNLSRLVPIWAQEHPNSPRAQRTLVHVLASMGLASEALDHADYSYRQFPYDLSFPLMSLDIACVFGLPKRYDLSAVGKNIESHRWTDGLRPTLEKYTTSILDTECRDDVEFVHTFLMDLSRLPNIENISHTLSSYAVLSGNLYVNQGDGDNALKAYLKVDEIQPTVSSAIRLTGFFMQVRDYRMAKYFLKKAEERNESLKGLKITTSEFQDKFELISRLEKRGVGANE